MLNTNRNESQDAYRYVTVIGSSNTDMVVRTSHIPIPGETVMGGEFMMLHGGKGANQAVAIARLGGAVYFVAKLGKDVFGTQSKKALEKEGVHVEYVSFDEGHPSGVALISVDDKGENSIVVAPGANAFLGIDEINMAGDCIIGACIILMQLEIPLSTVEAVSILAKKYNKKIILNPAPACSLPDTILNGLYLITPNHSEAEMLTGIKVTDEQSCMMAAQYLKNKGVQNVIITLGNKGAYVSTEEFTGLVKTTKVKVVDTTGAGDIFTGSLALALLREMNMEAAVRFANHVAGISVTKVGAQASIPYPSELETELKLI